MIMKYDVNDDGFRIRELWGNWMFYVEGLCLEVDVYAHQWLHFVDAINTVEGLQPDYNAPHLVEPLNRY